MPKQPKKPLSPPAVEMIAARFKLLGEPIRIQILQALHDGPLSVTDITRAVGSTQPNVSKHLKMLQDAGVVARRPEGNSVFYSIADPDVIALCDAVCDSVERSLARAQAVFR
jgi:DNA-binding transcriptional ArsR family regulator